MIQIFIRIIVTCCQILISIGSLFWVFWKVCAKVPIKFYFLSRYNALVTFRYPWRNRIVIGIKLLNFLANNCAAEYLSADCRVGLPRQCGSTVYRYRGIDFWKLPVPQKCDSVVVFSFVSAICWWIYELFGRSNVVYASKFLTLEHSKLVTLPWEW